MSSTVLPVALTAHLTPEKRVEGRVNIVTDGSGNGTVSVVIPEAFGFQLPRALISINGLNTGVAVAGTPSAQIVVGTAVPIGTISAIVRAANASSTVVVSILAYSQN